MATLSELLQAVMGRARVGAQTLSNLTGIPRTSIENWREGIAGRPRHWRPLLQIAQVLMLAADEVDAMLAAAGHPTLAALAHALPADHPDWRYLRPWLAAPSVSYRHQLRTPAADFVGRTDAIETLAKVLRCAQDGTVAAICSVQGMGGIGKTELAIMVAHQLSDTFPDAQIMINLRGASATPLPIAQALQRVIHAFTPDARLSDDVDALQQRYCTVLHGQRAIILADDARDAAQVRPLLPPPGCALLVTSRTRFTLPGMATIDLELLDAHASVRLLRTICGRLSAAEAAALARSCGYLPLALRISASILHNTPALAVADYLARLADTSRLPQLCDPDDAQLDVAASLALSYAQLDVAAQRVFRQLGVFAADFATGLARAVIGCDAGGDIEMVLHHLLRRNLVMYDAHHSRWRLHDLIRGLALRYLDEAEELEAAQWRYAQSAVQILQEVQEQYDRGGDDALLALARFDAERLHIDAARRWAVAHPGPAGDTLLLSDANATYHFGELRYDIQHERIPQLQDALGAARRMGDTRVEVQMLNGLGNAYRTLGDARRAIPYYEQGLPIARKSGDRRLEGAILTNLGNAYGTLGEARRVIPYYEQGLIVAREIGDLRLEGAIQLNLSAVYAILGEHQRAVPCLEQGLAIARQRGDQHLEEYVLSGLGSVAVELGEPHLAIDYLEQALAIARAIGDRRGEGNALGSLALAYAHLDDARRAIEACGVALSVLRAIGDKRMEGITLTCLARATVCQGDVAHAITIFEQALVLLQEVGHRAGEAECRWHFGLALAGWGKREPALPLLRAAIGYEQEIGHAKAAEHAALLAQLEAGAVSAPVLLPLAGQHTNGRQAGASD